MGRKSLSAILSVFLLLFYATIIMYVFFAIININTLANFGTAMTFEIIGICLLTYFVLGNVLGKNIKTGYLVPLMMVTIIYTVVLDIINLVCVVTMGHVFFVLINLIILFIYCVTAIPMYLMGRR